MKTFIIVLAILIIGVGGYSLLKSPSSLPEFDLNQETATSPDQAESPRAPATSTTPKVVPVTTTPGQSVIGKSVGGLEITAYHYGQGDKEILFVGGIHGGYSWNTALLAYELVNYLKANPAVVPENVRVTVIPVLNPDGLNKVVNKSGSFTKADVSATDSQKVAGRFNDNTVDLNRNFDCDWQASGKWQTRTVSGGTSAFSEPESQALKSYVETNKPVAVVAWYSAASGVFASNCHNGVSTETRTLTSTYAKASGYPAYETFDFYKITGDMVNWLAKNNIPAISVLLTNHEDSEWTKNKAGIEAVIKSYAR